MTGADRSPATADEVGEAVRSVVFVVPAHDEELVVGRCLQTLLAHSAPGELRIVVVSNGSTDATADRARDCAREGERLTVLELPVASKIEALRAGLSAAGGAPVVVLDADVELPTSTARTLAAAVAVDGPLVAAPRLRFELEHASAVVRRYYRVWSALPYATGAAIGSGVYALTAGRCGPPRPRPGHDQRRRMGAASIRTRRASLRRR